MDSLTDQSEQTDKRLDDQEDLSQLLEDSDANSVVELLGIKPHGHCEATKTGGSLRITLIADALRDIGVEPQEISDDDEIPFLVSTDDDVDGRIILDRAD